MTIFNSLFNILGFSSKAYKSMSIAGSIHNTTDPTLSFIDWIIGYNDYAVVKHKPRSEDMAKNMFYFYKKDNDIFYITKSTQKSPAKIDKHKNSDFYQKLDIIMHKQKDIGILPKDDIYKYLLDNEKFNAGLKYALHKNILLPYKLFERDFKDRHPLLRKSYNYCKRTLVSCAKFATSETGCRIFSLSTMVALSIVTGGTFFATAAAAYSASVAFSIARQTLNRVGLNRLRDEAELLKKYAVTYARKIEIAAEKNITLVKEHRKKESKPISKPPHEVIRWIGASIKYLSIYTFEVAVPVAAAFLSPVHAVIQLSIMVSSAGISAVAGVILKKNENDQRHLLNFAIKEARKHSVIPDYKNLNELRKLLSNQERQLAALEKVDVILSKYPTAQFNAELSSMRHIAEHKSRFKEYTQALYQTINPFDKGKDLQDSREEVSNAVKSLNAALLGVRIDEIHKELIPLKDSIFDTYTPGLNKSTLKERSALFDEQHIKPTHKTIIKKHELSNEILNSLKHPISTISKLLHHNKAPSTSRDKAHSSKGHHRAK